MKISKAVDDYISDEENSIPGQALNSTTHGAYSYLARSAKNKPISADVARVEAEVVAEADEGGSISQVRQQAIRLQTAAELLWRHMMSGADPFNKHIRAWGWLCNSAIRGWREVEVMRRSAAVDDVATNRVLQAYDDDSSS